MRSLASEIIAAIAPRLGYQLHLEPTYKYVGQLIAPDGRKLYFRNTNFDLNGQAAAETADDKDYAAYFLQRMGYPVPEGRTFFSADWARAVGSGRTIDAGYRYARELGFPVIVKPNSKSLGVGVAKVQTRADYYRAMRAVFDKAQDRVALVQRVVAGDDYRVVVLDGEVLFAYRRSALTVTGDGRATVRELLRSKARALAASGRDLALREDDYRLLMGLRRRRFSLDSVPAEGQRVPLLDNANLSTGGDSFDVTETIHPGYRELAVSVARDMALRYCGVDLLTTGAIDEPPKGYTILELNAAPGLDHYARSGPEQMRRVEAMYERILRLLAER